MTKEDKAELGGNLFEAYLRFEEHTSIPEDELDLYIAEQIGDFLLFIATHRAGKSYDLVPDFIDNYTRVGRDRAQTLADAVHQGMDQHARELMERYRHKPRGG